MRWEKTQHCLCGVIENFDFEVDEMSKDGEKTNVHVLVTFFDCFGDGTTDK